MPWIGAALLGVDGCQRGGTPATAVGKDQKVDTASAPGEGLKAGIIAGDKGGRVLESP